MVRPYLSACLFSAFTPPTFPPTHVAAQAAYALGQGTLLAVPICEEGPSVSNLPTPQIHAASLRLSSVSPVLYSALPSPSVPLFCLAQELSVFLSVSPGHELLTNKGPCSEQRVLLLSKGSGTW